jgi:hypothetical protein
MKYTILFVVIIVNNVIYTMVIELIGCVIKKLLIIKYNALIKLIKFSLILSTWITDDLCTHKSIQILLFLNLFLSFFI